MKGKTELEMEQERNDAALVSLLSKIPDGPVDTEEISIEPAAGRVLACEVAATLDEPPYSKATANGFLFLPWGTALASTKKPMTFEVIGEMPAPTNPVELPTGKALRVKNGEYMSIRRFLEGNYAVLAESDEIREQDGRISVTRLIEKHENIVVQGSVWKNGNILFEKGHRIQTQDLFVLASQGIKGVRVGLPTTVAIFSSGAELLPLTEPCRLGHKYDCNRYGLAGMVREVGGLPLFCGILPNALNPAAKKLKEALEDKAIQMVVISGNSSVRGQKFKADLMRTTSIAEEKDSEKVAEALKLAIIAEEGIRPCVLGILYGKPVICIAGDPQQAVRGFQTFVRPVIGHLLGEKKRTVQTEDEM